MCRATFWSDLRLIGATFMACLAPLPASPAVRHASMRFLAYPPQPAQQVGAAKSFETAI